MIILAAVIPSDGSDSEGDRITHQELWSSWDGPLLVASGIIMIAFSVGLLSRNRKARYLWPAFFIGVLIHALVIRPDDMILQVISSTVWFFITLWYFFRRPTVVRYFEAAT